MDIMIRDNQFPSDYTNEQRDFADSVDNFDEFFPMKQFEHNFTGFISRRSVVETTENAWLENGMTGTDPDEIDYLFDDAENTLYNREYKVKIGCDVYELREDGLYNISGTGSKGGIKNQTNINGRTTDGSCFSNRRNSDFQFVSLPQDERVKKKVAIHSFFVRSSVKSKVVYYMYKRNKWRRRRADMATTITGDVYDGNCVQIFNLAKREPGLGFKKRRQVKSIIRWYEAGTKLKQTQHHQLGGAFDMPNGNFGIVLIEQ
jgi:hypothetical protein